MTGAICLGTYYGPISDDPKSSPLARITPNAPPFLLVHGDLDPLVPVADVRQAAERLRRTSSNAVVHAELRGGNHAFDLYHSVRFEAVVDAIEAFTAWVRSRERAAAPEGGQTCDPAEQKTTESAEASAKGQGE
ncbi:alpha/beta hydrolase [Streptomyces cyslabdanicus]|uniref:alpha/beta hydrolase n=1 Tax=Streptomyces cyslabdanicus TaxID=1470456 RepID=UPI00404429BC